MKKEPEQFGNNVKKSFPWFYLCLSAFLIFAIVYIFSNEFFQSGCEGDCHMHRCWNSGYDYDRFIDNRQDIWECCYRNNTCELMYE